MWNSLKEQRILELEGRHLGGQHSCLLCVSRVVMWEEGSEACSVTCQKTGQGLVEVQAYGFQLGLGQLSTSYLNGE